MFKQGSVGIIGLSFDNAIASPINAEIEKAFGTESTLGRSPLANLFAQNPDLPNSFDVRLDRSSDLEDVSTGTFLISEHLEEFAQITSQPKLQRVADRRWSITLDKMTVNGYQFSFPQSSMSNEIGRAHV